ncbi:hypothetical protein FHX15_001339 [Rhizobium sp. BK650]|uniref:hypothetical protein n=1 Tax=Rhizobium sp. BK650 TaxID=2586990 RepID=UPI0016113AC0|nr:hypothetical protein [Rhizobium sp. BK650]MBB3656126.1 hypothetical protein [Rhizobium sp. BK650]
MLDRFVFQQANIFIIENQIRWVSEAQSPSCGRGFSRKFLKWKTSVMKGGYQAEFEYKENESMP